MKKLGKEFLLHPGLKYPFRKDLFYYRVVMNARARSKRKKEEKRKIAIGAVFLLLQHGGQVVKCKHLHTTLLLN
jgi:hypothetical protein